MKPKTMKQIGRKYLAPIIIAGTLALTGCDKGSDNSDLPIYENVRTGLVEESKKLQEERKQKIEGLFKSYDLALNTARESFNRGITDGKYTELEQKTTHQNYTESKQTLDELRRFPEYALMSLPKEDFRLYNLLTKNLRGIDFSEPNCLEKALNEEGLNIKVETGNSLKEGMLIGLIGGGILASILGVCKTLDKRRK